MGDLDTRVRELMARAESLPAPQRDAFIAEIEARNAAALEVMIADVGRQIRSTRKANVLFWIEQVRHECCDLVDRGLAAEARRCL